MENEILKKFLGKKTQNSEDFSIIEETKSLIEGEIFSPNALSFAEMFCLPYLNSSELWYHGSAKSPIKSEETVGASC